MCTTVLNIIFAYITHSTNNKFYMSNDIIYLLYNIRTGYVIGISQEIIFTEYLLCLLFVGQKLTKTILQISYLRNLSMDNFRK